MDEFMGKAVLVIGAAGGIGKAIATGFSQNGATVIASDINSDSLEKTIAEISKGGEAVLPVVGDVSKVSDCKRIVSVAADKCGRLDIVINCAGVWMEGPSDKMTEEMWDQTIDVNLKGTFFISRYAIPQLVKTKGCIVNISSNSGLIGEPEVAIYCASKAGVCIMTKALAIELAPKGVRVNSICPGDVMTPMLESQIRDWSQGDPEGYTKRLLSYYPQGENARFIKPEEIVETVYFLASSKALPITGVCLAVDFGATAGFA